MKTVSLLFVALIALPALAETSADCGRPAPRGQEWKTCKNSVRKSETVKQYLLTKSGDLYATLKRGNALCQITSDVDDFKVSQHPNDAAMIYYTRDNDLYVLNKQAVNADGDCPKTKKHVIMANVVEHKIATNTDTTIVNAALDKFGKLVAWDNKKAVYTDYGVSDFQMNSCYGVKGKSFSSYVMFTIDYAGFVTKVKGESSGTYFQYISDKSTKGRYKDITGFKNKENVCQ
jgi:hypothetical protein